jgi:hypothetical protein
LRGFLYFFEYTIGLDFPTYKAWILASIDTATFTKEVIVGTSITITLMAVFAIALMTAQMLTVLWHTTIAQASGS